MLYFFEIFNDVFRNVGIYPVSGGVFGMLNPGFLNIWQFLGVLKSLSLVSIIPFLFFVTMYVLWPNSPRYLAKEWNLIDAPTISGG